MSIQRVRSKWAKTEALHENTDIQPFIPDTRKFNRHSTEEMLDRFGMIYVKPVHGTFGRGVIRVEKRNRRHYPYWFQSGERKYRYRSFEDMYRKLLDVKRSKPYLVQQGIELLTYRGRRFDLRVMVQKNLQAQWKTTGLIGRLAHPRKIVTNYHSGGTPMRVEKLLAGQLPKREMKGFLSRIRKLGRDSATALEKKFPRLKEIGVDVAIDSQHKPWILEVNTLPDPYLFRKLPDKSVFRRIYRYAQAYGRFAKRRSRR
jgi:hypothetical protein